MEFHGATRERDMKRKKGISEAKEAAMTGMIKPNGEVCTAEIVEDICLLTDVDLGRINVSELSQSQKDQLYDYAIRLHLRASDNTGVRLRPKPKFLESPADGRTRRRIRGANSKSAALPPESRGSGT